MPEGPTAGAPTEPAAPFGSLDAALLVALAFLWGAAYVFIREGILDGATPLLYAGVRYLLSAAIFALLALATREALPSRRAAAISAGVGGTLVIGLYGAFLYWGEQYTTGGYASLLSATAPILTVVVAYSILPAERLTRRALLGIGIGFAGAVVLVAPELRGGDVGTWPGPLFILGAFVVAAVGSVLLRRFGGGRQGLWQLGLQFAVASLVLGIGTQLVGGPQRLPLTLPVEAALAGLVVFSSVMGYFVYFTLHHRVGPIRANAVTYLLPLVGVGIGSGFFGEPISPFEIVGFLVVVAGLTLVLRPGPAPAPSGPRS